MFQKIIKISFILITLIYCSSCSYDSKKKIRKFLPKRPENTIKIDVNASQDFKEGWADGCEVGMSAGSNPFYKQFYKNNKANGYKMAQSTDYENAWSASFWLCYRTDYIRQKSSLWGSYLGGVR